ncbi:MAG: hypothetical protein ACKVTZ_06275 [Bacteroidia bacterium]
MKRLFFLGVFFSLFISTQAQVMWANKVIAHQFGNGQTVGQSDDYFPKNVFGQVSLSASPTSPANTPDEIVSLGRNGWIILGFAQPIIDGVGDDFIVFENAFNFPLGVFDEWLRVSVSEDGINWIDFPVDTLTGVGMAGRTPTNGASPTFQDVTQCGGDGFDLATVGLTQIQYIKVTDATKYQTPDKLSAELDAIAGLHFSPSNSQSPNLPPHLISWQNTAEYLHFQANNAPLSLELFDIKGQKVGAISLAPHGSSALSKQNLPAACYLLKVQTASNCYFQRIMW